jgi:hypothetical protein
MAIAACLVQAIVELGARFAISNLVVADMGVAAMLTWVVGISSLVFVSYLAARTRPGASIMLTALIVIAVAVQLALKIHQLPLWKLIAAVFAGPTAAFAGGAISLRRQRACARG